MNVLILGSGQLARMMALSGAPLGIEVRAVDVSNHKVVNPIDKKVMDIHLETAIEAADAISVEFEHIPEPLLEQVNRSGKLMPSVEAIAAGADRVKEKALLDKLDIANCPYMIVDDATKLPQAVEQLGERLIIKASRDGYDGYGQWRLSSKEQLPDIQQALAELDLKKVPLVVEKMLSFEREVSLVGARAKNGQVALYPLVENLHHQGQLHTCVAPAPAITPALAAQAEQVFTALVNELNYVGVLAVEFFQMGDTLLVNEIAPRVHNSGHWSMQGADICQFENHLRAICELPLGSTQVIAPSVMLNVIGCDLPPKDMLSVPRTHLHGYMKTPRAKRKMGHINITGNDYAELGEAMQKLQKWLPKSYFPTLNGEAERLLQLK
ncbi:MAG: 5-(carboxyamino)imidazole ribonucleotide synthase [Paraglaciecola chathamensis]|uniref:N5-carboxyaminoimidazole ribonucleotide synthase n=1 Tax=Paraglaciecola agarilytica NO2 TaxID=1125747 RepID=A0ABQ0I6U2_9ALTE|nr:5-(carboxyamino)imidazole ribonucleotide synthase [Paraglaciecola agarilytica]GAC05074.1 5-(carboxyamino)imidazole ribonucleotide synthase [Paraglaciecola agarilytica NO2]